MLKVHNKLKNIISFKYMSVNKKNIGSGCIPIMTTCNILIGNTRSPLILIGFYIFLNILFV